MNSDPFNDLLADSKLDELDLFNQDEDEIFEEVFHLANGSDEGKFDPEEGQPTGEAKSIRKLDETNIRISATGESQFLVPIETDCQGNDTGDEDKCFWDGISAHGSDGLERFIKEYEEIQTSLYVSSQQLLVDQLDKLIQQHPNMSESENEPENPQEEFDRSSPNPPKPSIARNRSSRRTQQPLFRAESSDGASNPNTENSHAIQMEPDYEHFPHNPDHSVYPSSEPSQALPNSHEDLHNTTPNINGIKNQGMVDSNIDFTFQRIGRTNTPQSDLIPSSDKGSMGNRKPSIFQTEESEVEHSGDGGAYSDEQHRRRDDSSPDPEPDPYNSDFDYRDPHKDVTMNDVFTLACNSLRLKYSVPRKGMKELRDLFRGAGNAWEIDNVSRRMRGRTIPKIPRVEATATKILKTVTGIRGIW